MPDSKGIFIGLDSDAAGGIDICADANQYIDLTTMLSNYKRILIYNATNDDFQMQLNGNASASLTLTNSTLTTHATTRGPISRAGSGTQPTTPTVAGVCIGLDSAAVRGIEICSSSLQYIDFASTGIDYKKRIIYYSSNDFF